MTLRVGIIGLGVGQAHVESVLAHPGCRLVSICDFDAQKLEDYRSDSLPGVERYREPGSILNDPRLSVVVIASYDNYHYEQVIAALKSGKHVFVEKPLCLRRSEASDIRNLLRENKTLKLSSNLILRKCPRFVYLKRLIAEGSLGRLFYAEADYNYGRLHKIINGWRGKIEGYSPVFGGGVHVVDLLSWLTGEKPVQACAVGNSIASENSSYRYHDLVAALLKFKSGAIGKVTVNLGCVYPHFHRLSLYGTLGTFEHSASSGGLLFRSRDASVSLLDAAPNGDSGPLRVAGEYPGAHKGELLTNFLDSLLGKAEPEIREDEIFEDMEVCFAIEESSRNSNSWVDVEETGF